MRASPANQSARDCAANSAAAVGVGARTSAQKSAIVKSVSCPTPEITGMRLAATARTTQYRLGRLSLPGNEDRLHIGNGRLSSSRVSGRPFTAATNAFG